MKVLLILKHRFSLWTAPEWLPARLRSAFPQHEFVFRDSYHGAEPDLSDAEVAITWSLRPDQLQFAKKLRWIHSPAAAVHQLMFPEFLASNILLTNAREVHAPVVAEHVIALIFALAKEIPRCVRMQQHHTWGQQILWDDPPRPRELLGATLGLVGLGSIGRQVAQRAAALGMRVVAVREHPEKPCEGVTSIYGPGALHILLAESDYVVLAAPVTPATENLINAERIAQMKPSACLINVGRGPLIDDVALVHALRQRTIAGAALDVFDQEPLAAGSPYWDLDNVLITPHTAALTEKLWERHFVQISENLRRYAANEPLLGLVDKKQGY